MKLISFLHHNTPSYGIVQGDDVLNLTPLLGAQAPDLKSLIAHNMLDQAAKALASHKPDLKFADLHLLPVITNPNKIVCVGLNYADHVRETGRELTESPALFLRVSESQIGHGQNIVRPLGASCSFSLHLRNRPSNALSLYLLTCRGGGPSPPCSPDASSGQRP